MTPMPHRTTFFILSLILILLLGIGVRYWFYLSNAHSSFENYYAFRGCVELLDRTQDSGTCRTESGQTIKIVQYEGKWYLDGDLPWACVGRLCFGI